MFAARRRELEEGRSRPWTSDQQLEHVHGTGAASTFYRLWEREALQLPWIRGTHEVRQAAVGQDGRVCGTGVFWIVWVQCLESVCSTPNVAVSGDGLGQAST